jgi:hypothetical protein
VEGEANLGFNQLGSAEIISRFDEQNQSKDLAPLQERSKRKRDETNVQNKKRRKEKNKMIHKIGRKLSANCPMPRLVAIAVVLAMAIMFAFVASGFCYPGDSGTFRIDATVTGHINGSAISGSGNVTVDPTTGVSQGNVYFGSMPIDIIACSCTSVLCWSNSGAVPARDGSKSLFWCFNPDPYFDYNGTFRITYNAILVGNISQTAHLTVVSDNLCTATTTLNGWYTGPNDLVSSPGYVITYQQLGLGNIVGTYTQNVYRPDGTSIVCSNTRRYTYGGTKILPFPEYLIYRIINVQYVNNDLTWKAQAYYMPVAAVGGIVVPVDKLGLLAPYIGIVSTIIVATAVVALCVSRVRRRKEKR